MVLVVIILVFTSMKSLRSWDITENDQYDFLQSWGVTRVKRQEIKIKSKFQEIEEEEITCDTLHKTEVTPFAAIIVYKTAGRLLCMGSIIDYNHILSSKRCFEKVEVHDLRVIVGYFKPWWGANSQVLMVRKILRHEYELAILRLRSKIEYTKYVRATRLPDTGSKVKTEFNLAFPPPYHVVGFNVDRFDVPGDFLDKEKTYKIKENGFTDFDECKLNYTKLLLDKPKLFCTLGNATYCWGGWGSPVLKWINIYYVQIGVVIADNCTSETMGPFLVARTDVYGDWIRGNSYRGHMPM